MGQAGGYRGTEPFHASENNKTRDSRDKNADGDEDAVDRKPKLDVSDKQKDVKPKEDRVDAQVGEQASEVVNGKHPAIDEGHRSSEPERTEKREKNGEHEDRIKRKTYLVDTAQANDLCPART